MKRVGAVHGIGCMGLRRRALRAERKAAQRRVLVHFEQDGAWGSSLRADHGMRYYASKSVKEHAFVTNPKDVTYLSAWFLL